MKKLILAILILLWASLVLAGDGGACSLIL